MQHYIEIDLSKYAEEQLTKLAYKDLLYIYEANTAWDAPVPGMYDYDKLSFIKHQLAIKFSYGV